jgi:hypothetical protein
MREVKSWSRKDKNLYMSGFGRPLSNQHIQETKSPRKEERGRLTRHHNNLQQIIGVEVVAPASDSMEIAGRAGIQLNLAPQTVDILLH